MSLKKTGLKIGMITILSSFCYSLSFAGNIRDTIEDRGYLRCGVEERPDFLGEKNPLKAMAINLCQALTLALFQDPNALKLVSIPTGKSRNYLSNRSVDLIMLGELYDISQNSTDFNSTTLFINNLSVLNLGGGEQPSHLNGQKICSLKSLKKRSLAIFSQKNQVSFSVLSYETPNQLLEAALNYKCKAVALPRVEKAIFIKKIKYIFPDASEFNFVSEDLKLGIVVPIGDQEWVRITQWFSFALLESERLNINSENVDFIASTTTNSETMGLLGLGGNLGLFLGLDKQWFYRVIKAQGNYKEIYDRHLGVKSTTFLRRGPNRLKSEGGLLQISAPPQGK